MSRVNLSDVYKTIDTLYGEPVTSCPRADLQGIICHHQLDTIVSCCACPWIQNKRSSITPTATSSSNNTIEGWLSQCSAAHKIEATFVKISVLWECVGIPFGDRVGVVENVVAVHVGVDDVPIPISVSVWRFDRVTPPIDAQEISGSTGCDTFTV